MFILWPIYICPPKLGALPHWSPEQVGEKMVFQLLQLEATLKTAKYAPWLPLG